MPMFQGQFSMIHEFIRNATRPVYMRRSKISIFFSKFKTILTKTFDNPDILIVINWIIMNMYVVNMVNINMLIIMYMFYLTYGIKRLLFGKIENSTVHVYQASFLGVHAQTQWSKFHDTRLIGDTRVKQLFLFWVTCRREKG